MHRALLLVVALASACALGAGASNTPAPPELKGDRPAIGRKLDLAIASGTGQVDLAAVPGRVTVICAVNEPAGLLPCTAALERFGDRVSVAGLWLSDGPGPSLEVSYRVFQDPGGKKLKEKLGLEGENVIVVDRQGRVRVLVAPADQAAVLRAVGDLGG